MYTSDLYRINLPDNWYSQENPEAECTIFYPEGGNGVLWLKAFESNAVVTDSDLLHFIESELQPPQSITPAQLGKLHGYSYLESTLNSYHKTWVLGLETMIIYASFTTMPPVDSKEVGEATDMLASLAQL
jgi:hypothetical protein